MVTCREVASKFLYVPLRMFEIIKLGQASNPPVQALSHTKIQWGWVGPRLLYDTKHE